MSIEIEGRIININPEETKNKLLELNAKPLGFYNFKRYTFDSISKSNARWGRLRTDGKKTTLTVKEIVDDSLSGTNEWEVTVNDFDEALMILEKLGLTHKTYQENTRDEFLLGDSKISIDHWPKLGYLLEIESEKVEDVKNCAELLGFDEEDIVTTDIQSLFLERGINLDELRELKF